MLLAELVAVSERVGSTRSRSAKIEFLADLIGRLGRDEVEAGVAFLTGEPRHGKIGVGWASLRDGSGQPALEPSLSIQDLDVTIDRLAHLNGPGSAAARRNLLDELFARMTAGEVDFVRRLLIGDLRQGALAGVVSEAVARAGSVPPAVVRRALMLTGNLPKVATLALYGDVGALEAVRLDVLRPILPMLAATAGSPAEALAGLGRCSVELKLDGARIQAHRAGAEVRLYTRNLNDVTARLPAVVDAVRALPVEQVILDGEVVGLDDAERPRQFQDTMSRFGKHDAAERVGELTVGFFDCMHVDGSDLLDLALEDRLDVLNRIAAPWRIPGIVTDDPDVASQFLDDAIRSGHEGIMVKAMSSPYEAGRRGQTWRKVKPVRTLDLVVLAAEWGHGRRAGRLSNLHLGAADGNGGWVMVGKTFKGLTDATLAWQTEAFQQIEVARDGIVVVLRPEIVVEIALDGVQRSTRYPGGVALRFARVRRYRSDKAPSEADTIDSVRALMAGS